MKFSDDRIPRGDQLLTITAVERGTDHETVGPFQVDTVAYSVTGAPDRPQSLDLFFNKYNAHLPPWHDVVELLVADEVQRTVGFRGIEYRGDRITGDLKSVRVRAHTTFFDPYDAHHLDIEGTSQRGVQNGSDDFRVDDELR